MDFNLCVHTSMLYILVSIPLKILKYCTSYLHLVLCPWSMKVPNGLRVVAGIGVGEPWELRDDTRMSWMGKGRILWMQLAICI